MKLFSSQTFNTLERSLDFASLKQKTISQNIANVDTPNYKAKQAVFKGELDRARSAMTANRTDSRHFSFKGSSSALPHVIASTSTVYNHNGNNVDIDKEMAEMAENQIYFNALTDRLNGKFNSLQTVIRGGK